METGKERLFLSPQAEEDYLLRSVQSEIDDFMKKMYQTLYG